jgi:hypothetical protein
MVPATSNSASICKSSVTQTGLRAWSEKKSEFTNDLMVIFDETFKRIFLMGRSRG